MKSILLWVTAATILCVGCAPQSGEPTSEAPAIDLVSEQNALLAADKAWSETIMDTDAFLTHVADDAYFMPFGGPLAQGDAIRTTWEGLLSIPGFGLEWQATSAEVGGSGDLGYTLGTFALITDNDGTAMLTEGKYVTVWSKQADGSWKVKVDCFNTNGPATVAGN